MKFLYYSVFMLFLLSSCSNTKYLQEGELLYIKGKVKVEGKEISRKERKKLRDEMEPLLRPRPNKKILGLRVKLYLYNIAGEPKKNKGIRNWLRNKVGEPPVLFAHSALDFNTKLLQNYAENKGYFNAQTTSDSTRHGKKATSEYYSKPKKQYKIKQVIFPSDSMALEQKITATKDKSFLKAGEGYDLDKVKIERERIDAHLKEEGYFYFGPDYLKVQIDSTVGNHQVDLLVKVKDETPEKARNVYKINNIIIYPNYSLRKAEDLKKVADSIQIYSDFKIIDPEHLFKPRIFDRTLYFKKNDLYNRTNHNLSLNRLVNLGVFKFVKNQFMDSDSTGHYLDAFYYLTPLPKKAIRVEVKGKTNSANYSGTELNINWSNRNTFKGAELLSISVFGGLEVQVSGLNKGFDVYRVGGETSLTWPRFVAPFKLSSSSEFVPRTRATLGYEYQNRKQLYSLNSFKASWGYLWKENIRKEHQLNVTDISFVSPTNVTPLYQEQILLNPSLSKVIEKQLIFGPTYTYSNTMEILRRHNIYFKGGVDLAGNAAGLISGANIKKGDTIKVFKIPFSQYVKAETELRHYLRMGDFSQIASRIIVGAGYPYGNSDELPFIRQFFIGGTNSIRAFRARSIGPGTFNPEVQPSSFLPDQSGDIKLEMNTEYRMKLVSVVRGAVFVDAGNIWLYNENEEKPGAKFSKDFLKELAVGTGVGLRFDLSFLILRTDLAFPIRKPYLPQGNRWVFDQVDFGDRQWRKENLVFNLAIGYPF